MSNRTLSKTAAGLVKARALIADKKDWCIHAQGRDRFGQSVGPSAASCTQRCLYGALGAVYGKWGESRMAEAMLLTSLIPRSYRSIADYNNENSHEDVLALMDKGIAIAIQRNI